MRTTITVNDQLLRAAKRVAAQRGVTLSAVIQDALRSQLAARPARASHRFKLITFRGRGPREGIDLDRTSALLELEDVERFGKPRGRAPR